MSDTNKSILSEAESILGGDRQSDYSDPVENFRSIAKLASILNGRDMTDIECCNVMIAVKLIRERYKHKRDNLVDLCGYAEILNRLEENDKARSSQFVYSDSGELIYSKTNE